MGAEVVEAAETLFGQDLPLRAVRRQVDDRTPADDPAAVLVGDDPADAAPLRQYLDDPRVGFGAEESPGEDVAVYEPAGGREARRLE
jgi:hypothetical protein